MFDPAQIIARELSLSPESVRKALSMLSEGNSVPFLARYRKEATGGLDEVQLRSIEARGEQLRELEARRQTILAAIEEQGALTPALRRQIEACETRARLEDLYLPFKKKRRTRATVAKERGLGPLAALIQRQPMDGSPAREARRFVDAAKELPDVETVLQGARDIVAEAVADRADVRARVRETYERYGTLTSKIKTKHKKDDEAQRFRDYFDYSEPIRRVPSHRYLAIARGEREGFLRVKIEVDADRLCDDLMGIAGRRRGSPWGEQIGLAVTESYKRLVAPSVSGEVRSGLKTHSDEAAIEIFAENLGNLLLSPPAGAKPVLGIDPGLRTGCKCAALDGTGRFLETRTLYLVGSESAKEKASKDLMALVDRHKPFAVVIGNGTGGRETLEFVKKALAAAGRRDVIAMTVSESGASIYSASDVAREEFPDLDLTIRGAISIGRRFQDPLAELVKIDPQAIGVGQYQHDVDQKMLGRKLTEVVETCVHRVGVALNTASAALLTHVSGLGAAQAARIVAHRTEKGPFRSRKELLKVAGLGPKTFEQAAGFLRIRGGKHPLDVSGVHPERYALVEKMARDVGVDLGELVGNAIKADRIDVRRYTSAGVGEPTLRDIVGELKKPGLDPRESFEPPRFRDDVHSMSDLKPGMAFEGVVTNVVAFGAFVDIGVHQDGLVHISQLSDQYVRDPREVVRVGQSIKVRVLEVDLRRKRISLSAKSPGR